MVVHAGLEVNLNSLKVSPLIHFNQYLDMLPPELAFNLLSSMKLLHVKHSKVMVSS